MAPIDIQSVEFLAINFNPDNEKEIIQNLKVLFSTPQGTVPFDRAFGIDISIIDEPINIAEGLLLVEYIDKARIYEPRVNITEISILRNVNSGILYPQVVIERGSE